MNLQLIRLAMISARSVLLTASHDKADDLLEPARKRVIQSRIDGLSAAIDEIDKGADWTEIGEVHIVTDEPKAILFTPLSGQTVKIPGVKS